MSKIIYDVIQRFEVENGVPRLISTNIQVIEGGEDLMSLAVSLLKELGFYDKFDEKRTSQYIGYRLKNPVKGDKRYQLVLAQRKEGLCISIPQDILKPYLLNIVSYVNLRKEEVEEEEESSIGKCIQATYWILPSERDNFLNSMNKDFRWLFNEFEIGGKREIKGDVYLNYCIDIDDGYGYNTYAIETDIQDAFYLHNLSKDPLSYLIVNTDKLFPYTWQVSISSIEVLEEFLSYFVKIIKEAK